MSNTMTFRLGEDNQLKLVGEKKPKPYQEIVIEKESLLSKLSKNSSLNKVYSIAPIPIILATTGVTGGTGIFWSAFMDYIFPYMLDIAKVFCAVKIAQGFYQEKRGGRDEGTGFGTVLTYGRWYLIFWLIPFGVELIDELGAKMLSELRAGNIAG